MKQTIKELYERKSMRVYEDRDISAEDKETILKAAFMAPTAGDQQMYTIIDVTDQELKEKLADSCDHQPFIAKAKMVLIFLADFQKWYDSFKAAGCEPRNVGVGDMVLAIDDAVIAAQNAVVAAESLGIGSCYIGDVMEQYEYHKELLHLPDYVFPAAMLVFGYPTEEQKNRVKPPRADRKYIVHENSYRRMDSEELKKLMSTYSKEKDYEEWTKAFCKRKYNSDFSKEMDRSVRAFFSQFNK